MPGDTRTALLRRSYPLLGIGLLWLGWTLASLFMQNPTLLPLPTAVLQALLAGITSGELAAHVLSSTWLLLLGFLAAGASAVPVGIGMAVSPAVRWLVEPFVELLRPIPPFAWISIALLGFGTGIGGKLFIVWVGAFFPVLLNTYQAARSVPESFRHAARTLGATPWFIITRVTFPGSLPFIVTGLRLGFATGWMSILAAEMVASSQGLGFMIADARELLQVDVVLMGVVVIGMIGYGCNQVLARLERWSVRYKHTIARG